MIKPHSINIFLLDCYRQINSPFCKKVCHKVPVSGIAGDLTLICTCPAVEDYANPDSG